MMALFTVVEDRVSTYPGRIKLTAVSGQANIYDMSRADDPVQEGTPLNAALLNQKANTLSEDVTLYVSPSGDDYNGDGSSGVPFATIQKAIDSLPKNLGGYTATIHIAGGTYSERLSIVGFNGGKLVVGTNSQNVTVRGIKIENSRHVECNITSITWASGFAGDLYRVGAGSSVTQLRACTIDCTGSTEIGLNVTDGATFDSTGAVFTVKNCTTNAIGATSGARASLGTIAGSGNSYGLLAYGGAVIAYSSMTMTTTNGNVFRKGGRIITDNGSVLANASVE